MTTIELAKLTDGTEYSLFVTRNGNLQLVHKNLVIADCEDIDTMESIIKHVILGEMPV